MRCCVLLSVLSGLFVFLSPSVEAQIVEFGSTRDDEGFHFVLTYPSENIALDILAPGPPGFGIRGYLLNDSSRRPHRLTTGMGRFSTPLEPPAVIPFQLFIGPQGGNNLTFLYPNPFDESGILVRHEDRRILVSIPHDSSRLQALDDRTTFEYFVGDGDRQFLYGRTGEFYVTSDIFRIPEPSTLALCVMVVLTASCAYVIRHRARAG